MEGKQMDCSNNHDFAYVLFFGILSTLIFIIGIFMVFNLNPNADVEKQSKISSNYSSSDSQLVYMTLTPKLYSINLNSLQDIGSSYRTPTPTPIFIANSGNPTSTPSVCAFATGTHCSGRSDHKAHAVFSDVTGSIVPEVGTGSESWNPANTETLREQALALFKNQTSGTADHHVLILDTFSSLGIAYQPGSHILMRKSQPDNVTLPHEIGHNSGIIHSDEGNSVYNTCKDLIMHSNPNSSATYLEQTEADKYK